MGGNIVVMYHHKVEDNGNKKLHFISEGSAIDLSQKKKLVLELKLPQEPAGKEKKKLLLSKSELLFSTLMRIHHEIDESV